jgi:hypothetical protein
LWASRRSELALFVLKLLRNASAPPGLGGKLGGDVVAELLWLSLVVMLP